MVETERPAGGRVRITLGSPAAPCVLLLAGQIQAHEARMVSEWAFAYAENHLLSFYEARFGVDSRLNRAFREVRVQLDAGGHFGAARHAILDVHQAARDAAADPVQQALLRAVAHALSAMHVPRHALGILFYGSAAFAYDGLGTDASAAQLEHAFASFGAELNASLAAFVDVRGQRG